MSIIVKSFQKYASVPDFLLKFQTEVRDRLSETLTVDPSATVAETVMRYFSAQFWPRPEASVYINLPEIQIVNPDEQKIIEAVRQHIQVSDRSTYQNACSLCYKEISPSIVTAIGITFILALSFMFGRIYKLGLVQFIKIWMVIGAISFFVYMAFYVQSISRAIYLLVLSTPVYGLMILFLMQRDVRIPESPFRRQTGPSRFSNIRDQIYNSSPIKISGRRQSNQVPNQTPNYQEQETLEELLNNRNIN